MADLPIEDPLKPVSTQISVAARITTTAIIICWGLLSACALAYNLLIEFDLRTTLVAIVPLAAVWASLDRKRWGRMTLLFVSAIAWVGYIVALLFTLVTGNDWMDGGVSLSNCVYMALRMMWNDYPPSGFVGLGLAAVTIYWMLRPEIVLEFGKGKQLKLSPGQRVIAILLAFCWTYAMLFTSLTPVGHKKGGPILKIISPSVKPILFTEPSRTHQN